MKFTEQQEKEARLKAVTSSVNPDEIVSTDFFDSNNERIEMPIWMSILYNDEYKKVKV